MKIKFISRVGNSFAGKIFYKMNRFTKIALFVVLSFAMLTGVFAQKKNRRTTDKKPPTLAETASSGEKADSTTEPAPETKTAHKKNERPGSTGGEISAASKSSLLDAVAAKKNEVEPAYVYEFSQPDFLLSQIIIKHDESGKGTISFLRKGLDEPISDPVHLSPATLEKINNSLKALNFFESNENYQYEKDYSHLGNIKIKVRKDGRERETKFNYTTNPEAKNLADEYRKIGQQYIWIFDINLARENQPLESPRLFDALDSMIRRSEISDPQQMISFLRELSNDERMPLISRNHAGKIIKQIEKTVK